MDTFNEGLNGEALSPELVATILFSYNLRAALYSPEETLMTRNAFSLFGMGEKDSRKSKSCKGLFDICMLHGNYTPNTLHRRYRYVGLKNLGATCYMNCYLQTLYMNPDFRHKLLSIDRASLLVKEDRAEPDVVTELRKLFITLQSGTVQVADPSGVARTLRISTDSQQDATEFATLLLMTLEKELGGSQSQHNFIPELFRGIQTQKMTCGSCGNVSTRKEDFYELRVQLSLFSAVEDGQKHGYSQKSVSINASDCSSKAFMENHVIPPREKRSQMFGTLSGNGVPDQEKLHDTTGPDLEKEESSKISQVGVNFPFLSRKVFHLETGLANLFRTEKLKGDNLYMCNVCKKKVEAERRVFLESLPPYLHICFERYAYAVGERKKLTSLVDFPLSLSVKQYCLMDDTLLSEGQEDAGEHYYLQQCSNTKHQEEEEYELVGILEHQGMSALTGHYVAYIRDLDNPFSSVTSYASKTTPVGSKSSRKKRKAVSTHKLCDKQFPSSETPTLLHEDKHVDDPQAEMKEPEIENVCKMEEKLKKLGTVDGILKNKKQRGSSVTAPSVVVKSSNRGIAAEYKPSESSDKDYTDINSSAETIKADQCENDVWNGPVHHDKSSKNSGLPSTNDKLSYSQNSLKKKRLLCSNTKVIEAPGSHRTICHKRHQHKSSLMCDKNEALASPVLKSSNFHMGETQLPSAKSSEKYGSHPMHHVSLYKPTATLESLNPPIVPRFSSPQFSNDSSNNPFSLPQVQSSSSPLELYPPRSSLPFQQIPSLPYYHPYAHFSSFSQPNILWCPSLCQNMQNTFLTSHKFYGRLPSNFVPATRDCSGYSNNLYVPGQMEFQGSSVRTHLSQTCNALSGSPLPNSLLLNGRNGAILSNSLSKTMMSPTVAEYMNSTVSLENMKSMSLHNLPMNSDVLPDSIGSICNSGMIGCAQKFESLLRDGRAFCDTSQSRNADYVSSMLIKKSPETFTRSSTCENIVKNHPNNSENSSQLNIAIYGSNKIDTNLFRNEDVTLTQAEFNDSGIPPEGKSSRFSKALGRGLYGGLRPKGQLSCHATNLGSTGLNNLPESDKTPNDVNLKTRLDQQFASQNTPFSTLDKHTANRTHGMEIQENDQNLGEQSLVGSEEKQQPESRSFIKGLTETGPVVTTAYKRRYKQEQLYPSHGLKNRWAWIQFDDATVSEWKIEHHFFKASAEKDSVVGPYSNVKNSCQKRLSSRSAYLIIYKAKNWKPTTPLVVSVQDLDPKDVSEALNIHPTSDVSSKVSSMDPQLKRRFDLYEGIKQSVYLFHDHCRQLKDQQYTFCNEWPLLEYCLASMVFVPMGWWTRFSASQKVYSPASPSVQEMSHSIRTTPTFSATGSLSASSNSTIETKHEANQEEKSKFNWSKESEASISDYQVVMYDEILCPHYLSGLSLIHRGSGEITEASRKYSSLHTTPHLLNSLTYNNRCGVDPLAIWDGKAKLLLESTVRELFEEYRLMANIPHIKLSKLICLKCANGFSDLVECYFEQHRLYHDLRLFVNSHHVVTQDSLETPDSSKDSFFKADKAQGAQEELPEILTWISRRVLFDLDSRFSYRDKNRRGAEGTYTIYHAADDVRRSLRKLRAVQNFQVQPQDVMETTIEKSGTVNKTVSLLSGIAAEVDTGNGKKLFEHSNNLTQNAVDPDVLQRNTDGGGVDYFGDLHKKDITHGVLCLHGKLLPNSKSAVALVPKQLLDRFLALEEQRSNILTKTFLLDNAIVSPSKVYMRSCVNVSTWEKRVLSKSNSRIMLCVPVYEDDLCCICKQSLEETRQRTLLWRQKVDSEKASLGDYIFRRSCKMIKLHDVKRYATYCLEPGRHYLLPTQWLRRYTSQYLMAKNEESAILPGVIDGRLLLTSCTHRSASGIMSLMYDPASYLDPVYGVSLHPKENPRLPESDIYVLVHQEEFNILDQMYGSVDVPYLTVVIHTTLHANQIFNEEGDNFIDALKSTRHESRGLPPSFVQFSYSISICDRCVRERQFSPDGPGYFTDIVLRLCVESCKASLGRQTSRRQVFTVSGCTEIRSLVDKFVSTVHMPLHYLTEGLVQLWLEGPVIAPFFDKNAVRQLYSSESRDSTEKACLNTSDESTNQTEQLLCCRPIYSLHSSNAVYSFRLLPSSTQRLSDLHVKIDSQWCLRLIDSNPVEQNS